MTAKIGYLTIDDAPSEDFESKVDFLVDNNIPAIFFCQGSLMEQKPDEIIRAIHKDFVIGNHSYDHPPFSSISLEKCKEQITKTDDIIEDLYKRSGIQRPIRVFRFPHIDRGEGNDVHDLYWESPKVIELQTFLGNLGYRQPKFENISYKRWTKAKLTAVDVDASYDSLDWTVAYGLHMYGIKDLSGLLARMDEDVPEEGRGLNYEGSNDIIMMHDWLPDMPKITSIFQPMIRRMIEKGIKFEMPRF
jgi:peptidoglycan/xylan/chitin deacetylase (PgdA/CDA1 family)